MAIMTKDELSELIEELKQYKGRHTELITVYIPAGYDVNSVQKQLEAEQSTAKNIKSTATRKNVVDALEKIVRFLKDIKGSMENGMAVFCGNVSKTEGQDDLQLWSVEPPRALKVRMYRCDKDFVLEPLEEQLEVTEIYALLVMDRKEATIGVLEGKSVEILQKMTSGVPSKVRAGGQCHPFGTLIQLDNGDISLIENLSRNVDVKSVKNISKKDFSLVSSKVISRWDVDKEEIYKITTKFPQLIIESSKDHLYFVFENEKIVEKSAEDLVEGDFLIMPEKITIPGKMFNIDSRVYYNSFMINKEGREFIKRARIKKGLSQGQLAKKMDSVQTVVSYYEIGRQNAKRDFLLRLCDSLDIDFVSFVNKYTIPLHYRGTSVELPSQLNKTFAQFLGYYIGDGSMEEDRVTFFEQRKDVALEYKRIYDDFFNINSSYRFRDKKNYHQIRFTSRPLVNLIRAEFPEIKKTLDTGIPKKILMSDDEIVSGFLRGYFDAEGYVIKDSIGVASNNKTLIEQVLFLLLRFSIIPSFQEYDNRKNPYSDNPIFKLQINEKESIKNFRKFIGFTSMYKKNKLDDLIELKTNKSSVRQLLVNGRQIAEIIKKHNISLKYFSKVSSFFQNKRMMGKAVFKESILDNIEDPDLYKSLYPFYEMPLIPVKIAKVQRRFEKCKMVDIETKNHNFIANGLIVHNSSQRFHRITEGLTKDFYKRIADEMKTLFYDNPKLKGILVGGPIPTKDEFLDNEYLPTKLQEKVLGRIDLGGSDESGIKELVEKSQDLLANQEIVYEKKLLERFFETLGEKPDLARYKEPDIRKALEYGAVSTLLISKDFDRTIAKELKKEAERIGSEVEIVSTETEEGKQFYNLSGIGAMLRFKI